jgi:hypothetical protein
MLPNMPSVLMNFVVPFSLTLASLLPLFFAGSLTGNGRRAMLTATATLLFIAVLSFIWGDLVRGPFANLTSPRSATNFVFQAGIGCVFPVSQLKDGIDFGQCIEFGNKPIQLWIQKTWWSGLKIKASLYDAPNDPVFVFDNNQIQYVKSGGDVNSDDYALELVGPTREPAFQVVIAKDYSAIYVNALLRSTTDVMIMRGRELSMKPIGDFRPEDKLDRIFKYPSYLHQGEHD